MNKNIFLFVALLLVSNYANSAFFVVDKGYSETIKIIDKYLAGNSYQVEQSDDRFFEIYFDTPELFFFKNNGFIRFKAVEYLSRKKKKSKYNENIEYTSDGNSFYNYSVKHYKSVQTFEEKHPLLSLVKRKERQLFLERLSSDSIKYPMRLKKIVQVSKLVHTFELISKSLKKNSISISKLVASSLDSETEFVMLGAVTENNQALIADLVRILGTKDNKVEVNEYLITFKQMENDVDLFYWILRYPYFVNLLYGIGFGLSGMLIIFILFRKRLCNS